MHIHVIHTCTHSIFDLIREKHLSNIIIHVLASYLCTCLCARGCVSIWYGIPKGFLNRLTQSWKTYSSLSTAIPTTKGPRKRAWKSRGRGSQAAPKVRRSLQRKGRHLRQTRRPFDVRYDINFIVIVYEQDRMVFTACYCLKEKTVSDIPLPVFDCKFLQYASARYNILLQNS